MRQKGLVLDQRVRAVTKAAARLFSTRRFMETSMEEIAQRARMSKGGVYHYCGSKTEILYAIVSDFMDKVLEDIEAQLAGLDNAEERLSFLVRRHLEIYIRHMHAARGVLTAVTFSLLGMCNWIYSWHDPTGPIGPER